MQQRFGSHDFPLCASVEDTSWWAPVIHYRPEGMSASPPCQPFSWAGDQFGVWDARSKRWPYLLLLIALIMPKQLLLENVVGFVTHDDWAFSHKGETIIGGFGYLVVVRIMDASAFAPTIRKRWFLMAVRGDCVHPTSMAMLHTDPSWLNILVTVRECVSPEDRGRTAALALWTDHHESYYSSQDLLPWMGYRRILNECTRSATFMRSYGHAHELSDARLLRDKLHGTAVQCNGFRRFATASEVAALMGYGDCDRDYWLDQSLQDWWWRGLGDSVVPLMGSFVWSMLVAASQSEETTQRQDPCNVVWRLMMRHRLANSRRQAKVSVD